MLNLVLGSCGSGKTTYILNSIRSLCESGKTKPIYFIVPEQSSYNTERSLLELLGEKNAHKAEVLSFTRVVELVGRKAGGIAGKRISESEKHIIMAQTLYECRDRLSTYNSKALKPQMATMMLDTVNRLKLCGITSTQLYEASESGTDLLSSKLHDTALIYDEYCTKLNKNYVDPSDDLEKLCNKLSKFNFFKNSTVFIDGFSGFTKNEYRLIGILMQQAESVNISLCYSPKEHKSDKYKTTYDTYLTVKRIAAKNGIPVNNETVLQPGARYKNPELAFFEQNLFSQTPQKYDKSPDNIRIIKNRNIYSEAKFVCAEIKRLVSRENCRYKDIVLISRDIDSYKAILDAELEKNNIPCFADYSQHIDTQPLMLLVLSLLETACRPSDIDSFMRIYKTGLTNVSNEDISEFENYIIMWNIKGDRLYREFTENPYGFGIPQNEESTALLNKINNIRERMTEPVMLFKKSSKNATAYSVSKGILTFLENAGTVDILSSIIKDLEEHGNYYRATLLKRLWDMLMKLINSIVSVCGDETISLNRYSELFHLIVNTENLESIPKAFDTVTFGSSDRIRPYDPKVVFLLGVNDGEFPMPPQHTGIFSRFECLKLKQFDIELYDDSDKIMGLETFFAYSAASAPSERIYLSYHESNLTGEIKKPSVIITQTKSIFPNINEFDSDLKENPSEFIWSKQSAFEYMSLCDENSTLYSTLREYFVSDERYGPILAAIDKMKTSDEKFTISRSASEKLFGKDLYLSPSQIERYHNCPFSYFCAYGLKAKERKRAELDGIQYGSLVHRILEKYLSLSGTSLTNTSPAFIRQNVIKLINEYVDEFMGGYEDKGSRFKYLCYNLCESVIRLILQLTSEFSQSEFRPDAFEMEISSKSEVKPYKIIASDGSSINIIGKIDRVDTFKNDGKTYVRVVDYKTNSKKFILADIIHGLNMQMLLYLEALSSGSDKRYKEPTPAGILYMPSATSLLNVSPDTDMSEAEEIVSSELTMNGLLINDYEVLKAMERDLKGRFIPVVLESFSEDEGAVYKKSSNNNLVSINQMGKIFNSIDTTVRLMGESIKEGKLYRLPVKGAHDACEYCPYISVCSFKKGDRVKKISSKAGIPLEFCEGGEQ